MIAELDLKGRKAIVTGSSRGIGKSIALVLAEAGADLVIASRTALDIEQTAQEVRDLGRDAIAIQTDVTKSEQVDAMVNKAINHFGAIDIMVNNAGQLLRLPTVPLPGSSFKSPTVTRETISRTSDEEWSSIMEANLDSVFYCCRAIAPHMIERRYGKIINISSNNSVQAFPLMAAYNTSKARVNMLTKVLALEWAPYNICVNGIGPGDYDTQMTHETWIDPVARKRHISGIPLGREGDLRELGVLAVYLSSAASDYMTGQICYMDGGLTAK